MSHYVVKLDKIISFKLITYFFIHLNLELNLNRLLWLFCQQYNFILHVSFILF